MSIIPIDLVGVITKADSILRIYDEAELSSELRKIVIVKLIFYMTLRYLSSIYCNKLVGHYACFLLWGKIDDLTTLTLNGFKGYLVSRELEINLIKASVGLVVD